VETLFFYSVFCAYYRLLLLCSVYAKILAVCGLVLVSAAGNILVILAVARHRAMRSDTHLINSILNQCRWKYFGHSQEQGQEVIYTFNQLYG
jgi:hypothetical protein